MPQPPHSLDFLAQQFPSLTNFAYLAAGGQKAVYAAVHNQHGKVALKILLRGASTERFAREIEAVRKIQSVQVPAIHEYGQLPAPNEDQHWLIEQWIDGMSLRDKLNSGPISNQLNLQIAFDILSVLIEAEAQNIVHRDIKPENILIAHDDSHAWLVDFGIARHLDLTSLTAAFMPCSIGYAPLEQLNAAKKEIDSRSDLFSLGVTMYECVQGVNPYIDGLSDDTEVVKRMHSTNLPYLTRQVDVKGDFKELVSAMTRPSRNHRIGSAKEAYEWMKEIFHSGAA